MFDSTATAAAKADCLAFAEQYPTPNTKRAIALADAGRISWTDLAELFRASLAKAIYA